MPLHIFSSNKKAGVHTNKIDPEPYFNRWEACMPLGSKDQPELVGQPCYKHKKCGHLVKVPYDRIPPVVCPWCNTDTVREELENRKLQDAGVHIIDAPQTVVNLKEETFTPSDIQKYLSEG